MSEPSSSSSSSASVSGSSVSVSSSSESSESVWSEPSSASLHSVHHLQLDQGSDHAPAHPTTMMMRTTSTDPPHPPSESLNTATTFRDDVRHEWMRAVLGDSWDLHDESHESHESHESSSHSQPPRQGQGLAQVGEYTTYSVTIPARSSPTAATHSASDSSSSSSSLGLSLSRLALGVYVRKVTPGSEAWCAGIPPQSVLVSINGMALLAEPSKQALERLWQYEGYATGAGGAEGGGGDRSSTNGESTFTSTSATNTTNTATPGSGRTATTTAATRTMAMATTTIPTTHTDAPSISPNRIHEPLHMVLIHGGRLLSFLLLSNPPYGIDWAPCGNFCLVKKCKGKALQAGILPGSILTTIHSTRRRKSHDHQHHHPHPHHHSSPRTAAVHWQDLDHTLAGSTLRNIYATGQDDITISFCILPRKARSGYYEDGHNNNNNNNNNHVHHEPSSTFPPTEDLPSQPQQQQQQQQRAALAALVRKRTAHKMERPKVAAAMDGVEIRVHPLLPSAAAAAASPRSRAVSSISSSTTTRMKSLSQLAFRVAAGEFFSFSMPQSRTGNSRRLRCYYSQRTFKDCPPINQPLPDLFSMDQALSYLLYYHSANYDEMKLASPEQRTTTTTTTTTTKAPRLSSDHESSSHVVEFFRTRSSASSKRQSMATFLLPMLALIRRQGLQDSDVARMVIEIGTGVVGGGGGGGRSSSGNADRDKTSRDAASTTIHLAHCMEFMARALDLPTLREQLAKMREKRMKAPRQPRQIPIRVEQHAPDSLSETNASVVTRTTVLSTAILSDAPPPQKDQEEADAPPAVAKSRKGFLGLFRKKKTKKNSISKSNSKVASTMDHHKPNGSMKTFQMNHAGHSPRRPVASVTSPSKTALDKDKLFANTLAFLEELEAVCSDIERSLLRSFSQKIAAWALQPWSASKETELAQVTLLMRERLGAFSTLPLLNPIDSSVLLSVDTQGSYILPSAHFPLLLTFDYEDTEAGLTDFSSPFGEDEAMYRTKVQLLGVVGHTLRSEEAKRCFVVHGSVGGAVVQSGPSHATDRPGEDRQAWDNGNILVFESRSSWGPPLTLSLLLSQTVDNGIGTDENGNLKCEREIGHCFMDMSSMWKEVLEGKKDVGESSQRYRLKVLRCRDSDDFDQNGDLVPRASEETPEDIEILIKVAVQKILPIGAGGVWHKKRSLLYKHDDDLRQELFAIDFVKSCDQILRSCGLDLKLVTFRCIPVGQQRGFIEWIHGSVPVSEICQPFSGSILGGSTVDTTRSDVGRHLDAKATEDPLSSVAKAGLTKYESLRRVNCNVSSSNPIQDFLRAFHYNPDDPYMIRKSNMETYVKSCAGYCAITYLLGVGDRHLDNLLLHPTGHFFHCDYSFILGHDPKKYLPLRITEDMVNGMGGRESDNYAMFLSLTCAAFLTFRRPENVRHVMSFVRLMDGSCTFATNGDSKQPLETALCGIRERLRLDLSDDEAISFMERLVEESCASKMWIAVDAIHSIGKRF